jgi:phosphohistidine phosphatase SixA
LIFQQTRDFVLVCVGIAALTVALAATLLHRSLEAEKPTLVTELQGGGFVLVTRHAAANPEAASGPTCEEDTSLSQQGRSQALAIYSGLRRLNIPVMSVMSSTVCGARETAALAFPGSVTTSEALSGSASSTGLVSAAVVRSVQALVGTAPAAGTNTAVVTHREIVAAATGVSLAVGETAVFQPLGNMRFKLLTRILPSNWKTLGTSS